MIPNTVSILMVEDDSVERMAIMRAFEIAKIINPVFVAADGIEALEILRHQVPGRRLEKPYLVMLDINMPRMNGFEFLAAIKDDPELKDTLVFVLSTSSRDIERMKANGLNVAGYMVKSTAGDDFKRIVSMLEFHWELVKLLPVDK